MRGIYGMGSDNTNRRTVETEFKKAMVRVNVPVGLLVTAFGNWPDGTGRQLSDKVCSGCSSAP